MVLRVNVTILPELSAYLPSLLILQVSLQQQMAWPCEHANGPLPVKQGPLHAVDPRPFCFTNAVAPLGRAAQPHEEKRRRGGRLGRSLPAQTHQLYIQGLRLGGPRRPCLKVRSPGHE